MKRLLPLLLLAACNDATLTALPTPEPLPTLVFAPTPTAATPVETPVTAADYTWDDETLVCHNPDETGYADVNADGILDYVCSWDCTVHDVAEANTTPPDHLDVVAIGGAYPSLSFTVLQSCRSPCPRWETPP